MIALQQEERKNKIAGMIGSITAHALLVLLLILIKLASETPLEKKDEGILINFGTSEEGMGNIQPQQVTSPTTDHSDTPEPLPTPSAPQVTNTSKAIVTQNVEEALSIKKETSETKEVTPQERPREPDPKALYTKNTNTSASTSGSEGETGKPGDQGSREGNLNANTHGNITGKGNKGISFSLSGRQILKYPSIQGEFQETGKVVVEVAVDRNGKVTKAVPGTRGTTTSSAFLFGKAKKSALETKFDPKPDAPEEQRGTITFVFILE